MRKLNNRSQFETLEDKMHNDFSFFAFSGAIGVHGVLRSKIFPSTYSKARRLQKGLGGLAQDW